MACSRDDAPEAQPSARSASRAPVGGVHWSAAALTPFARKRPQMNSPYVHDAIVIGAGMAGLAAAHALRGSRVRLLEREARPGGRVCSVQAARGMVDLGAVFAYGPGLLPPGAAPPLQRFEQFGPIGIHWRGANVFGRSARDIVDQLALPEPSRRALVALAAGQGRLLDLPEDAARVARALFYQVHPCDISEYSAARQGDLWFDWYPHHWSTGNGHLVDAYAALLGDALRCGATVTRITETDRGVLVEHDQNGTRSIERARAVVLATDAGAARALVVPEDPACAEFLRDVRYGRYTVVGFAVDGRAVPDFRYLIAPEGNLRVVLQQSVPELNFRVLLCYYDDDACRRFADKLDDRALVASTSREFETLGLTAVDFGSAAWWVKRWPLSGTVLDEAHAARKRPSFARATRRVFLAGDYLSPTPGWGYGLDDAVASGRATGALVGQLLATEL